MINGDASTLIVNNHQVGTCLGGFAIEREWLFLSYYFIEESIHEDAPHAVLIFVTEQTGDCGCINGFAVLHYGTQL